MVHVSNLKLAFIHPDLGIGGAERLVVDVAVALADQGVQVHFVTNHFDRSHAFNELKDDKYPVTVVGDWLPRNICGVLQALWAYIRMCYLALVYCLFLRFTINADIFFVDQIPIAVPFLKMTGKQVIYYCHHPDLLASPKGGFWKKLYRRPIDWLEQYGTNKADLILVNSHYTQEVFKATFPKIEQQVKILYPTIASSFLRDIAAASRKPVHEIAPEIEVERPDDVVFLSINRYHPAKQLELAIDAMAELRDRVPADDFKRVHLIIAGGYDPQSAINAAYFRRLVELTHKNDLVVKVVFLKSPSDKAKADLLKSCDALIYTPTNEHFGIVPLEAMAAKKAVIACNSGGPKETVEHNVTGFLCEPTGESMADFMQICIDKKQVARMGQMGHQRLADLFSYEVFRKQCMDTVTLLYQAY